MTEYKGKWIVGLTVLSFLSLLFFAGQDSLSLTLSIAALVFLMVSIMASVHFAEEIAHSIGEGLGALLLALSVTVIEVGLIVSLMNANPENVTVARDTVFAAVMIVTNGIVGICLFLGGLKYKEIGFEFRGAGSFMVVLITLSVLCFILPNYTTSVQGPLYTSTQLIFVSLICLTLYFSLVLFQTKTHKSYFLPTTLQNAIEEPKHEKNRTYYFMLLFNLAALVLGLVSVIGLAKILSPSVETIIAQAGAPKSVVGLVIATIVLLPEGITAIFAARDNRLQTSLNLALGSGAASIALTVPVVSFITIFADQQLVLGLTHKDTIFLILTFIVSAITLGNGKATALHGAVHLLILASFFAMTIFP